MAVLCMNKKLAVLYMNRKLAAIFSVGAVGCFILGIIIGHFSTTSGGGEEGSNLKRMGPAIQDKDFVQEVLNSMDTTSIRSFLETLSAEPHIAASERDRYVISHSNHTIHHSIQYLPQLPYPLGEGQVDRVWS